MSNTFAALADPAQLALGEATVNQLAAPFALSLPGVSKHLKVLQRAGLIIQGRRAHWRPCTIDAVKLKDVSEWVEHYRSIWEERFARPSMSSHQMARALSIGPMTLVLELHVPEVTADLGGALLAQWYRTVRTSSALRPSASSGSTTTNCLSMCDASIARCYPQPRATDGGLADSVSNCDPGAVRDCSA